MNWISNYVDGNSLKENLGFIAQYMFPKSIILYPRYIPVHSVIFNPELYKTPGPTTHGPDSGACPVYIG